MGEVNFYLKAKEKNTKKSLIYLQFKYGHKLVFSFGETIDPNNWNKKKQRVKNNNQTTSDGKHLLNDLLDELVKVCSKAYNTEIKNGVPLPETLKRYLRAFINQNTIEAEKEKLKPTLYNLIDRFTSGEIKKKGGREKSGNTLHNYNSLKLHLLQFEKEKKYKINFDKITLDFFHSYTTFLQKEFTQITRGKEPKIIIGLSHNTIAKDIDLLKALMNKAVSLGLTTNLQHKNEDFMYAEEETDAVYVHEKELEFLFDFDCGNEKLNNTKDLFVAGSWLGLRYSDLKRVGEQDLITLEGDKYVRSKNQKTGKWVYIPLHPMVLKVMERYKNTSNSLPKAISPQKFNEYLKDVFKKAGLDEKGRLETDPKKPLSECVSSHTMRRSMASNFYLLGVSPEDLMPITGHSSRKSFDKYIKVSKLDKAKKLNGRIKQLWEKTHSPLKAVV